MLKGWPSISLRPAVVVALACTCGTGCAPEARRPRVEATPLVASESQRILTAADLLAGETLGSWVLASAPEGSAWRLIDLEVSGAEGDELLVRSTSTDPKIVGEVDVPSEAVSSVEIDVGGSGRYESRLFWAAPGEPFAAERSVAVRRQPGRSAVQFMVSEHPGWVGRIGRLRFDPTNLEGMEMALGEIRLMRRGELGAGPDSPVDRTVKFDLDGDTRNAVVMRPGSSQQLQCRLAPGARLRFSLAGIQTGDAQATVIVGMAGPDGETRAVFERTMTAAVVADRWEDHEIELPVADAATYGLTFSVVEGPGGGEGGGSLVLWGNPEVLVPTRMDQRPNVLLVSVDTLRAESMSLYGYERETTPNLDRWAASEAVVFENAIAPSPWTKPSHTSLFTGIDALNHGANFTERVPERYTLLAERFREAGYRTVAVTGGGYLRPEWGFAQGFDVFDYWAEIGGDEEYQRGLEKLAAHARDAAVTGRPFFWFFHTYEVHSPYRRRPPYYAEFASDLGRTTSRGGDFSTRQSRSGDDEEMGFRTEHHLVELRGGPGGGAVPLGRDEIPEVVAAYDSGIAHVDAGLAVLFDVLRSEGLYDNTIVVVTSDHGEAFGEHGHFAHTTLYDTVLRVPLIIKPAMPLRGGGRSASQVRLTDVAPTILELAGLAPLDGVDGSSLLPLMKKPETIEHRDAWSYAGSSNSGVSLRRDNRVKAIVPYTVFRNAAGLQPEVFDLLADPQELENLAPNGDLSAVVEAVESRLSRREAGVRVSFANSHDEPFWVDLKGRDAGLFRAKSESPVAASSVAWTAGRGLVVEVRPGAGFEILLDGYSGGRIQLRVSRGASSGPSAYLELTREDLAGGRALGWNGAAWEARPPQLGAPPTGVLAVAAPDAGLDDGEPALGQDQVDQLRALGYLQ